MVIFWKQTSLAQLALVAYCGEVCDIAQMNAHRERASTHYKGGNLPLATQELRRATIACAKDPFNHFMLGNALYRAGHFKEARASYELLTELQPGNFEGQMSLGFTLFELGENFQAVDKWLAALRLETESAFARAALAIGLFASGDTDNALIQYEQAVKRDRRYAEAAALTTDIRWKPGMLILLEAVNKLYQKEQEK